MTVSEIDFDHFDLDHFDHRKFPPVSFSGLEDFLWNSYYSLGSF